MDIAINLGWVLLGLTLLYFGAEWLVKGAGEIAIKLGISPLVVGLTVVAFGTSAPELLVSVSANLKDPPSGDFALGNVVGSNICNLALVLGVAALIRPLEVHRQVLVRELPILIVATLTFVGMLWNGRIERWEGGLLALGVVAYTVSSIMRGRNGGEDEEEGEFSEEEVAEIRSAGAGKMVVDVVLILVGLAALTIGADRLVLGGGNVAALLGVPEAVIALSLVAFGTSLPEVATVVVASLKKQSDLVTGNAVGSCIFNLLAVIGIAGSIAPLSAKNIQMADLGVMSGITLLALPFFWSRKSLSRIEGVLLLVFYTTYCCWLFIRQS